MKRIVSFLLILCCFACILGCSSDKKTPEGSVAVFYKKNKTTYGSSDGVSVYAAAAGLILYRIYL